MTVPKCTLVVSGEMSIYSTSTSSHDDRCLVIIDNNGKICHHQTCKNQRAILANSQKLEQFECKHLKMADDVKEPLAVYKSLSLLASYPCDDTTKAKLKEIEEKCSENLPIAVKIYRLQFKFPQQCTVCSEHHLQTTRLDTVMSELQRILCDVVPKIVRQWPQQVNRLDRKIFVCMCIC